MLTQRILMTADTIGGVWTYALELAAALGKQGIQVALATMGTPLNRQQWASAKQIHSLEVFESSFKLEWMEDPWEDVKKAGEWLLHLEQQIQPDVVHLNGYAHGSLPWQTPVLMVGHSCVLSWWEAVKSEPTPASWDRYRQEVKQGLQAADLVIAPSAAMLAALNRHYGNLNRAIVVPNAGNSNIFYPSEKKDLILTAGRLWDEAKNVAILEEIAPQLKWPVYVAGEGRKNLQLDENVEYPLNNFSSNSSGVVPLGHLSTPELAQWYAHASIYALPARYEPFGLSVLEAALSGCALLLGDIPSLREIWGDTAVFVNPNDQQAITQSLNTLITNSTLRHQLAKRARTRALEYTPERMATDYLKAYHNLTESQSVIN